ncbi:hypothetical protein Vafri_14457, partial [Volvox africanus]
MEEDIGLAELGVTARNAALVEAEILEESLAGAGDGSGDAVVLDGDTGPGDDVDTDLRGDGRASAAVTVEPPPAATLAGGGDGAAAAAANKDGGRRERQWAAQLSTVETEIAAMEKALEVATEALGGARDEEVVEAVGGGGGAHPLLWRESSSLQVALLRDRLAGLRDEQERLQELLAIENNATQQQQQQQQQQQEFGSGAAMSPTLPSRRPRFGARALARVGAGCGDTQVGAAAVTEAAADRSVVAHNNPQHQHQHQHQQEMQVASKKVRTAMVLDHKGDDPLAAAAVGGSGSGSGSGSMALAETEKDRLIRSAAAASGSGSGSMALAETEKDRLIRRGLLTPFDRLTGFERKMQNV